MATVRKAVITAAGRGTRMYPASAAVPKEMFPLVDRDGLPKPVVQLIVEEAIDSGIEEVCIVVQPGGEAKFRDYFRQMMPQAATGFRGKDWAFQAADRLASLGERLRFAVQSTPDGFGHAVYQAKSFAGNDPILLLLGDHIHVSGSKTRCARQLIDVYERQPAPPASVTGVQPTPERLLHLFGTIRGTPLGANEPGVYRAQTIVEKPSIDVARQQLTTAGLPAGQFLAHFGMWIFSPAIFDSLAHHIDNDLRDGGEFQLTAAQEHLRAFYPNDYLVAVLNGRRYDTGVPQGVIEAQLALALNGVHQHDTRDAIDRLLTPSITAHSKH